MNRVAALLGGKRAAWVVSLLVTTVIFGLCHEAQGLTGIVQEGFAGLLLGLLYLAAGRTLAIPIVAHGVSNTLAVGAQVIQARFAPLSQLLAAPIRPATNPDHVQDGTFAPVRECFAARIPRERACYAAPRPTRAPGYRPSSPEWLPQPSSSRSTCRRSTRLFQYGGPRLGELSGTSVGSPAAARTRAMLAESVTIARSLMRP